MAQFIASFALWALARADVMQCGVRINSAGSLPTGPAIYVTVTGSETQLSCAQRVLDAASQPVAQVLSIPDKVGAPPPLEYGQSRVAYYQEEGWTMDPSQPSRPSYDAVRVGDGALTTTGG